MLTFLRLVQSLKGRLAKVADEEPAVAQRWVAKAAASFDIAKIAKNQKRTASVESSRVYFKVFRFPAVNQEMVRLHQKLFAF